MKGNLHGFLLAALMIAIAIGGTAHHLATLGPDRKAPRGEAATTPAANSAAAVGLLVRRPRPDGRVVDDGPGDGPGDGAGCGAAARAGGGESPPRCDGAAAEGPAPAGAGDAASLATP